MIISSKFVLTSVSSDEPTQRTSTSSKTTIPNNKRRLRLTLSSCDTINCTVEAHIERKQLQRRLLLAEDIFNFSKPSTLTPLWFNSQTKMFHGTMTLNKGRNELSTKKTYYNDRDYRKNAFLKNKTLKITRLLTFSWTSD